MATAFAPPSLRLGVTQGMRGYFAILYDGDTGEVWDSGIGSYATREGAEREAQEWAEMERLPFDPPQPPARPPGSPAARPEAQPTSAPAARPSAAQRPVQSAAAGALIPSRADEIAPVAAQPGASIAPLAAIPAYAGIGSRRTPPDVLSLMRQVAEKLARAGWLLRSGAADGADTEFEEGARIAAGKAQIFLPWRQFNGSASPLVAPLMPTYPQAERIAAEHHPAWDRLGRGARLLMTRNVMQVLGANLVSPVRLVLAWAPNPRFDGQGRVQDVDGGTGLAIRLAYARRIPVFHLGLPEHLARVQAFLA